MANPFLPDDDALRRMIHDLVVTVDIRTTGIKAFMKLLAKHVTHELAGDTGKDPSEINITYADVKTKSEFIRTELTIIINKLAGEEESEDDDEEDDGDDSQSEEETSAKAKKKRSSGGGGGGLAQEKVISPELAKFLRKTGVAELPEGVDDDKVSVPRTAIVKGMWEYIRKHGLQNPSNKREILLDKRLKKLFGVSQFTMFTMNRYISAHIEPFPSLRELEKAALQKEKEKQASGKKRKASGDSKTGRKQRKARKQGAQPPYRLSDALSELLGTDVLPRPQVVSKIWDYIRANNLQNPNDKREIICDDRLKAVMGNNDRVTMFSMNKYLSQHMLEKLDRSEYDHDADD